MYSYLIFPSLLHFSSFSSEEVSLIVPPQQPNHHDKRSFAKNKAALFVRNRTKHFRKKNNAPKLISEEEEGSVNATKQSKTSEEISIPIQPPKNKNNTSSVMTSENNNGTSNLRTKELGLKQSRYLWKNARKRMNYVVGFIRKKDDDEVMLIEESERHEFTNYKLQVRTTMRRHSFSSVYETSSNIGDGDGDGDGDDENTETQTTMNQKYLSPQGIKIQNVRSESRLSSSRNSHRSSRRSSLDSSVGAMNSFISQMYLKKSQSNYSISSIGMGEAVDDSTTAAENKKEELFEECFFHSDTFQRDGNLACIENQLYDSVEENIGEQHTHTAELSKYGHGRKEFHISENDIRDIVNEEVNSYLDDSLSKTRRSPNRRQNNNNVKQSSAFSYSVNDLYDLFANKETSSKLKNIEVNFDGLVV